MVLLSFLPEEAQGGDDAFGRISERQSRADGSDDHEQKSIAIHFLATKLVTQPSEEELTAKSTAKSNAIHSSGNIGWERARLPCRRIVVVETTEKLGNCGDTEEVISVCEEAHSCNHDGSEMVPLRLGSVQCSQHLEGAGVSGTHPCPLWYSSRTNASRLTTTRRLLLQQSKLFAVEVRLSIKTCKDFQALNYDKGKQKKEYADSEAHGGANLCPGRQSGRHREKERERERERERDLERETERCRAGKQGKQARERERERREAGAATTRAPEEYTTRARRSTSLGPV